MKCPTRHYYGDLRLPLAHCVSLYDLPEIVRTGRVTLGSLAPKDSLLDQHRFAYQVGWLPVYFVAGERPDLGTYIVALLVVVFWRSGQPVRPASLFAFPNVSADDIMRLNVMQSSAISFCNIIQ
jgi:hypothetical protein